MHINCTGGWGPYGYYHHCDEHHGAVDIHNAIPYSCDTFFYMLGDKLGIDRIAKYATEFGYGQKTGIDLPGEQAGLMPSRAVEAEELPRPLVSRRDARRRHRAGRCRGHAAATGAHYRRHRIRMDIWSGRTWSFPTSFPPNFYKALLESFPGRGNAYVPIDSRNWITITDGMAEVTQPRLLPHRRLGAP